jgi:hypothetical protein
MTARTVATLRKQGRPINEMTERNIEKVTRYREKGQRDLERMVKRMEEVEIEERNDAITIPKPRDPRPSKEDD